MDFQLTSPYKPTGDQPRAIEQLTSGITSGIDNQVLLGVTGSGKTFTMANVITNLQRPALIISHNKTLAAQLYQEFRSFFPNNAVSYFVSYYDYYQPEAYIPRSDTYIEKETEINEEIDKLRLAATANLLTRKDSIIVASVSCIYNIGSPKEYGNYVLDVRKGLQVLRDSIAKQLVNLQYTRADYGFHRGTFRMRGDTIDIFPAYEDTALRIIDDGSKVSSITKLDPISGKTIEPLERAVVYPAKHYMTDPKKNTAVFSLIRDDLDKRIKELKGMGKPLEAHRLQQKVNYDLEMIEELGFVNGIENYSRYFDGRKPGDPPYSLLDYFQEPYGNDWLLFIDESHMTIPQVRGMYNGDRARKQTLIDFGFRLPAALDNRPLRFDEFQKRMPQTIFVSATPSEWEISRAKESGHRIGAGLRPGSHVTFNNTPVRSRTTRNGSEIRSGNSQPTTYNLQPYAGIAEQLIRPTGIVDPEVVIRPTNGQVLDLVKEIIKRKALKQRVLVTTLTKRMAEDLATYMHERKYLEQLTNDQRPKTDDAFPTVRYLHSDVLTLERSDILDELRAGKYDVLIGINLLREGLDLPEVSLVAILDADKEGFLRSDTSLIQTMGRAARHIEGQVIMYADKVTGSMNRAIEEIRRRRVIQLEYNQTHNITPMQIHKPIRDKLVEKTEEETDPASTLFHSFDRKKSLGYDRLLQLDDAQMTPKDKTQLLKRMKRSMKEAADTLNFELAAKIRDRIRVMEK